MKRNRTSKSTARSENQSVSFALVREHAREVFVAGTFNNWNPKATALRRQADRQWQGELKLPPGTHEYQFVVDGQWLPDPQARESAPNPYGTVNSVIRVSAGRTELEPVAGDS